MAARRARTQVRRYCAANRLNRLATLTYRPPFCRDPKVLRAEVGTFFRSLRRGLGGEAFPYLWTGEWHKDSLRLHAHFAVGRYVSRSKIEGAWLHGFVHIKLLGDLPMDRRHSIRRGWLRGTCRSTSASRSPHRHKGYIGTRSPKGSRHVAKVPRAEQ